MIRGNTPILVLLCLIGAGRARDASRCANAGECCSWEQNPPPPPGVPPHCCGAHTSGEEVVQCVDDQGPIERETNDRVGWCRRGRAPCYSGHDRPECNAPSQGYAATFDRCKRSDVVGDDVYGGPALHAAVVHGDATTVRRLATAGSINSRGNGGATPLHMAGMSDPGQRMVRLLVSLGADLESVDAFGYRPLHRFSHNNLVHGAEAMLEAGADPNAQGRGGITPLHLAAMSNDYDMAAVLVRFGADLAAVDGRGATPFDLGLFNERAELTRAAAAAAAATGPRSQRSPSNASEGSAGAARTGTCAAPGRRCEGLVVGGRE